MFSEQIRFKAINDPIASRLKKKKDTGNLWHALTKQKARLGNQAAADRDHFSEIKRYSEVGSLLLSALENLRKEITSSGL